jgi:hypothetical protein
MHRRRAALDVAQQSDGMDDHLGESGRKGAPVRGIGTPDWTVLGVRIKRPGILSS